MFLEHWLLRFVAASAELRLIVEDFVKWLGNGRPPRATYWALKSGRLIALEKQPRIRPVGVGETWRWMMVKFVLVDTASQAKEACSTYQLYSRTE